jgi:ribosomal protein S18 acetylase RimI-like enzyme
MFYRTFLFLTTILAACNSFGTTRSASSVLYTISRGGLASIFTAAFYMTIERMNIPVSEASLSSPVFNVMYLRELDRLKENYTKDENLHQIVVAKSSDDEIIGYIDIDRRNIFNKRFPTPYVSDLVVQPSWRNKGVATSLLEYCSDVVCKVEWTEPHLHLLVETNNRKALNLYSRLQFIPLQAETGPMDDLSLIKIIPINYVSTDNEDGARESSDEPPDEKKPLINLTTLLRDDFILAYDRVLLRKDIMTES